MRFSRTSKWNVLLACIILLLSPNLLFAADRTEPPTVESVTGPTSGIVGNTYNFSAVISSTESNPMSGVFLEQTTNPDTTYNSVTLKFADVGDIGCSSTSCTLAGSFTPTISGTYYIYLTINYEDRSCNTHPSLTETNCFESRGRYITFVVTAEEIPGEETPGTELPDTGIENIYISIIGIFFIMIGVVIDKYIHPTRRETVFIDFEDKFKDK